MLTLLPNGTSHHIRIVTPVYGNKQQVIVQANASGCQVHEDAKAFASANCIEVSGLLSFGA